MEVSINSLLDLCQLVSARDCSVFRSFLSITEERVTRREIWRGNWTTNSRVVIPLRNVYGSAAHCHASVFSWINEVRHGNKKLRNERRPGRPYRHETDAAIRSIRHEDPNASLRTVVETLSILTESFRTRMLRISYRLKTLRWISYALTRELKKIHFTMCLQLFPKLRSHAHEN
jgi:hypothetical protein